MIIGKAALEEYATSGNYSNDPWGQVWNAFKPSKSAHRLQRRLGDGGRRRTSPPARSARRPATRCTRPASGASLVTLRGTDGLESGSGIMPLSWLTDFGGVMTRSRPRSRRHAQRRHRHRSRTTRRPRPPTPSGPPTGARRSIPNALQGKRIGYIPSVWEDPFGTTGTIDGDQGGAEVPHRRGRDDRRDGLDRGRHRTRRPRRPSTRPATRRRKAGCSTSTRTRSWPSRASRSATRSTSAARRRRSAYVAPGSPARAPSRRPRG